MSIESESISTPKRPSHRADSLKLLFGAALLSCLAAPAQAAPGSPVFYGGGLLDIINDPTAGGAYLNPTYLGSLSSAPDVFLFNRGTSEQVQLSPLNLTNLGYNPGDELKFYIVSNEGTFYTGSNNADVTGSPYDYYVSFEDQILPGDLSYHNAAFSVSSKPSAPQAQTPVPGPLPLLGSAMALTMSRRLRQRIKEHRLPVASAID
jgi:hypothetical protein